MAGLKAMARESVDEFKKRVLRGVLDHWQLWSDFKASCTYDDEKVATWEEKLLNSRVSLFGLMQNRGWIAELWPEIALKIESIERYLVGSRPTKKERDQIVDLALAGLRVQAEFAQKRGEL